MKMKVCLSLCCLPLLYFNHFLSQFIWLLMFHNSIDYLELVVEYEADFVGSSCWFLFSTKSFLYRVHGDDCELIYQKDRFWFIFQIENDVVHFNLWNDDALKMVCHHSFFNQHLNSYLTQYYSGRCFSVENLIDLYKFNVKNLDCEFIVLLWYEEVSWNEELDPCRNVLSHADLECYYHFVFNYFWIYPF